MLFGPGWNLYKLLSRLVVGSSVQPGGECDGKGPGADALMTIPIWRPYIFISGRSVAFSTISCTYVLESVFRIRMDPELLPGSGSGIIVLDPAKMKELIDKLKFYFSF